MVHRFLYYSSQLVKFQDANLKFCFKKSTDPDL